MLLVKPSSEILQITPNALQLIEEAGRTCYKSEDKITVDSAPQFATMLLNRGHESVLEHASVTVRIICDRGVSHEIVRHRLASYSQESTRYCNYAKGHITFILPVWFSETTKSLENKIIQDEDYLYELQLPPDLEYWLEGLLGAEAWYKRLCVHYRWTPEQARSVLPNSLKTEIVMTANLREWRYFFKLRTSLAAHPQMREIAIPLLAEFRSHVPILFDNI